MISAMSPIYSTVIGGWKLHHPAKICGRRWAPHRVSLRMRDPLLGLQRHRA
jgi:hypothetical protein